MVFEAASLGLRVDEFRRRRITGEDDITVIESLTYVWWPLEFLPFKRLSYTSGDNEGTTVR